jgi:hypothetical protein
MSGRGRIEAQANYNLANLPKRVRDSRNTSGGDHSLHPEGESNCMPEKKRPAAAPSNPGTEADESENALVSVAKTIGHVAGKLAVKGGIEHTPTPLGDAGASSKKKGKLAPKNKKHLPRREKKALQKATASRI